MSALKQVSQEESDERGLKKKTGSPASSPSMRFCASFCTSMGALGKQETTPRQNWTVGNESDQASLTHAVHHAATCAANSDHAVLHDV